MSNLLRRVALAAQPEGSPGAALSPARSLRPARLEVEEVRSALNLMAAAQIVERIRRRSTRELQYLLGESQD